MLSREELARERAASQARVAKRLAEAEPTEPNPYVRRRFGSIDGLSRKPHDWFDDMYVPPFDLTEVLR